jgi:long-chain acyl-CoA synthetase
VETAEVIRDGWFFTGDIGRMDEEGYFFLQDRLKDMINVGGLKVYPAEVENVLHRHQAVAEAAVFAAADPVLGESVRAHVVLSPGQQTTVEELAAFCREHLADYKVPSSMSFVESIPKSPTGKILKRVLREQAAALPALAPIATAERDARDWLIGWLAREVGVAPAGIDVSRSFFDHGVTSAAAVRLARELGDWLGQTVEATIAWKSTSVAGLAAELAGRTGDFAPATGSPSVTAGDDFSALTDEQLAALLRAELEDLREKSQ